MQQPPRALHVKWLYIAEALQLSVCRHQLLKSAARQARTCRKTASTQPTLLQGLLAAQLPQVLSSQPCPLTVAHCSQTVLAAWQPPQIPLPHMGHRPAACQLLAWLQKLTAAA